MYSSDAKNMTTRRYENPMKRHNVERECVTGSGESRMIHVIYSSLIQRTGTTGSLKKWKCPPEGEFVSVVSKTLSILCSVRVHG